MSTVLNKLANETTSTPRLDAEGTPLTREEKAALPSGDQVKSPAVKRRIELGVAASKGLSQEAIAAFIVYAEDGVETKVVHANEDQQYHDGRAITLAADQISEETLQAYMRMLRAFDYIEPPEGAH